MARTDALDLRDRVDAPVLEEEFSRRQAATQVGVGV